MKLAPLEEIFEDVRAGKPVVIIDDNTRENEGDIMVAAEMASPEIINFMASEGKGLICLSMTEDRRQELSLPMQVTYNGSAFGTNFAVSFDHRDVASSGVSVASRAHTCRMVADDNAKAGDFITPGYLFPVVAVPEGVLGRRGQTEGSVDLARISGLKPVGVICEIMNADGEMLRDKELANYCEKHDLKVTSVEEICQYRLKHEVWLRRVAECEISKLQGFDIGVELEQDLKVIVYVDDVDGKEHIAFVKGEPKDGCLVRIHSECLTGDVFGSARCDCGGQFKRALENIFTEGSGVLLYLAQEGRGIGLANKLRAYALQDKGLDTVDANLELGFAPDYRDYRSAANMLADLGLQKVRLMTNNPDKLNSLESFGVEVAERVEIHSKMGRYNQSYLETKREKLGHFLPPAHQ